MFNYLNMLSFYHNENVLPRIIYLLSLIITCKLLYIIELHFNFASRIERNFFNVCYDGLVFWEGF